MADLTAAGVTQLDAWTEGGINGKRMTVKKLSLVLAAAGSGAASNKIPAAVLGMSVIEEVSSLVKSDNTEVLTGAPNAAGNEILLKGVAVNTTASYTGTYTCIVRGQVPSGY